MKNNCLTSPINITPAIVTPAIAGLAMGLTMALAAITAPASAQTSNAQHATNWAKWAYGVEGAKNHVLDAPLADCSINQKGDTWYLGGQIEHKVSNRTCTVPQGKTLVVQVIGHTAFNAPAICNQAGNKSLMELKTATLMYMGGITDVYATVNGTRLAADKVVRTQSAAPFAITLPEDNIRDTQCRLNAPAGTYSPADTSGFYAIIEPLPVGTHTITTHAMRQNHKHQINLTVNVVGDGSGSGTPTPAPVVKLKGASVSELANWIEGGHLSAEQLVTFYLGRIEKLDKNGPQLNSIIELNPDALAIAKSLDAERKASGPRSPLHGIPVVLKASIDTADKMATTAGAIAMKGHIAQKDAFLVEQLRKAGAIILAKTNMTGWANFRTAEFYSGFSTLGGQTKNPYVLDRNPCGSSSGSAVAVAAELAPLAVGTETAGSLVCPGGVNGVVAFKPTVGLVSREGIIPISKTMDSPGPMGKSVKDIAHLMQAMAVFDANDSNAKKLNGTIDYINRFSQTRLDGLRIGVLENFYNHNAKTSDATQTIKLFNDAIKTLESLGAEIIYGIKPVVREMYKNSYELQSYEFKDGINRYLQSHGSPNGLGSLADLISYNNKNKVTAIPNYDQPAFIEAEAKGSLGGSAYNNYYQKSHIAAQNQLNNWFSDKRLDVIIGPTNSPVWKTNLITGDDWNGFLGSEELAAAAGYPQLTVPMGMVNKLPVGISFIGLSLSDLKVLQIGYAYEQASKKLAAPQFLPTR